MKVVFSDRAYAAVMAETAEKIKTETGGLFLGRYENQVWYVIEAIDPGPKSVFEVAYFEYDRRYTQHLINKVANLYREKLELIGLWHRHPGSLDVFSATDDGTNYKYAQMRPQGAISMLVNVDPAFRTTMYHVGGFRMYRQLPVEVGNEGIPAHLLAYKSPEELAKLMDTLSGVREAAPKCELRELLQANAQDLKKRICTQEITEPQLDEEAVQDKLIDALIGDIEFLSGRLGEGLEVTLREKYLSMFHFGSEGKCKLYFAYAQEPDSVVFEYNGTSYFYEKGLLQKYYQNATARPAKKVSVLFRTARKGRNGGN